VNRFNVTLPSLFRKSKRITPSYTSVITRIHLQSAYHGSKMNIGEKVVDPATGPDMQGCWQAKFGDHVVSWEMSLPDHLPSTFRSSLGKIRYRIVA
jgi:hypothetical protein